MKPVMPCLLLITCCFALLSGRVDAAATDTTTEQIRLLRLLQQQDPTVAVSSTPDTSRLPLFSARAGTPSTNIDAENRKLLQLGGGFQPVDTLGPSVFTSGRNNPPDISSPSPGNPTVTSPSASPAATPSSDTTLGSGVPPPKPETALGAVETPAAEAGLGGAGVTPPNPEAKSPSPTGSRKLLVYRGGLGGLTGGAGADGVIDPAHALLQEPLDPATAGWK